MTGLSLLTQGDLAEGRAAPNQGTMAAPLVLMGDTWNRIRDEDTWGDHMERGNTPTPPQKSPVWLHQTWTKPGVGPGTASCRADWPSNVKQRWKVKINLLVLHLLLWIIPTSWKWLTYQGLSKHGWPFSTDLFGQMEHFTIMWTIMVNCSKFGETCKLLWKLKMNYV